MYNQWAQVSISTRAQQAQVSISTRAQQAQVSICTKAQWVMRAQQALVSGSAGYESSTGSCFHFYIYLGSAGLGNILYLGVTCRH